MPYHNHGLHTAFFVDKKKEPYLRNTRKSQVQKGGKWIPYLRTENLKNLHTLFRGTYLHSLYMGVPPPRSELPPLVQL